LVEITYSRCHRVFKGTKFTYSFKNVIKHCNIVISPTIVLSYAGDSCRKVKSICVFKCINRFNTLKISTTLEICNLMYIFNNKQH
jgi:hypothetical protein